MGMRPPNVQEERQITPPRIRSVREQHLDKDGGAGILHAAPRQAPATERAAISDHVLHHCGQPQEKPVRPRLISQG